MPDLATSQLLCDDSELVRRAGAGEGDAFEALYLRHCPAVLRRLSHLGGPRAQVADWAQETFLRAYASLASYRQEASVRHWLLRIATNVARDHYRRQSRQRWRLWKRAEAEQEVPAPGASVDQRYPDIQAVHQALGRLSPALREAVVLYELEQLSLKEMAEALEIPLDTAATRLRRGREKLRRQLERLGYVAPSAPVVPLCEGEPR